jgi:CheY-like chemotaxis protein
MEATSKLLESIASILWPLIAAALIVIFRPAFLSLIESGKTRKFTLKIGGQELTMEEVNQQQRNLIADLQSQVVELSKRIEGSIPAQPIPTESIAQKSIERKRSVLWVDDQPKNNSYFVQQLTDLGVNVDLALSTADGLARLSRHDYNVVISDMGRKEDESYNPIAGLYLLKDIQKINRTIPVIFFCSRRGVEDHKEEVMAMGAKGITSSSTELFGLLSSELGPLNA